MRFRRERGQALPIAVMLLAFVLVVAIGLAHLARDVAARSAAQHAADATALAGALDGERAAAGVAARNDAQLVSFDQVGDVVVVEVRRAGRRALARAVLVVALSKEGETSPLPVGGG